MPFYPGAHKGDRVWQPNDRQKEFLQVPDSVFEALYGGAAGGGKSELLLLFPILRGFHNHPGFKGAIFRQTFPQLEESLIPRSKEYYPLVGGTYNGTSHAWTFPNGGWLKFGYMENKDHAHEHDTAEYTYLGWDELTAFTEYMYRYMSSRVRSSSEDLPALIRSATNPGNIGHSWVRRRFVEPWKDGGKLIVDPFEKTKRIFIPAKLSDNKWLAKTDPGYAERLNILPEQERKAKADGDWWAFSGQVFDAFRELPVKGEPSNAIHVIPDFRIPEWWPRIIALDWGYSAMTYAMWIAISPDGRAYIYREYFCKKHTVEEWSADILRLSQFEKIEMVFIDPSSRQNRGDLKSIFERFVENTNFYTVVADNDRVSGKVLVQDFLRWKVRPKRFVPPDGFDPETRDYILRNRGLESSKQYEQMFLPEPPETNIPRLQIFKSCSKIIETIPVCVYSTKKPEDIAEFPGDDPIDTLRYGLKGVDFFVNIAQREVSTRQKMAAVVAELHKGNDQTAYYRNMEHLEAGNNIVSVRRGRFH